MAEEFAASYECGIFCRRTFRCVAMSHIPTHFPFLSTPRGRTHSSCLCGMLCRVSGRASARPAWRCPASVPEPCGAPPMSVQSRLQLRGPHPPSAGWLGKRVPSGNFHVTWKTPGMVQSTPSAPAKLANVSSQRMSLEHMGCDQSTPTTADIEAGQMPSRSRSCVTMTCLGSRQRWA